MLFTSADYPIFLVAVFLLYGLTRSGRWPGALARMAVAVVLGDVVYVLLAKNTAALWDPIGGPLLRLLTQDVGLGELVRAIQDGDPAAITASPSWPPVWHYAIGAMVLAGSVALGLRAGVSLTTERGQAALARGLFAGVLALGAVVLTFLALHRHDHIEALSAAWSAVGHLVYLAGLGGAIGAAARDTSRTVGRVLVLFLVSCIFYHAWAAGMHGAYRYLLVLLLFTIILDYYLALAIERSTSQHDRRVMLVVSLVSNLGILALFKYYDFFATVVGQASGGRVHIEPLHLILPAGISFHTFQSLSYTIDVYRRKLTATRSVLQFATFVLFFPQLVAGPIVRASDLLPQLDQLPRYDLARAADGLFRIVVGLFKKIGISDFLGTVLIVPIFKDPGNYSSVEVAAAVYAYAFQIYLDFSAYSDIAIGSAQVLGFTLPENFRTPYRSANLQDFWRRWHISLSTWLRDYLYVPLGGSRGSELLTYRNLMLTMLLGGLWHGNKWTFIVWGMLHGGGLAVTRYFQRLAGGAADGDSAGPRTSRAAEPAAWGRVLVICGSLAAIGLVVHYAASSVIVSPWIDLALAWMYLTPLWAAVTAWLSREPAPVVTAVGRPELAMSARAVLFALVLAALAVLKWMPAGFVLPLVAATLVAAAVADAFEAGVDRRAAAAWLVWAARRGLAAFLVFHYVCAAWVFFRAETFDGALAIFRRLGEGSFDHPNLVPTIVLALAVAVAGHLFPDRTFEWLRRSFIRLPPVGQGAVLAMAALVLRELARPHIVQFIYFQF